MHCWGLNQGCGQWVIGVPMHDQWLPPAVFPKAVPGLFDGPVPMGWPVGLIVTHKVGQKTYFDGHLAVQQGHDPGYLILHTSIPILNYMLPVNMLTSKHKVEIPVTSVQIEGKFMGTYAYVARGLICSQPVSLPTGIMIPFHSTVFSDLTWEDLILGLIFIAMDIIVDAIWAMVFKGDKVFKLRIKKFEGVGFPKWYKRKLSGLF